VLDTARSRTHYRRLSRGRRARRRGRRQPSCQSGAV